MFPAVNQQICLWHINKNTTSKVKEKWVLEGDEPEKEKAPCAAQGGINLIDPLLREFLRLEEPSPAVPRPTAPERSPLGLLSVWKSVIYAKTEEESDDAWRYLQETFPLQQPSIYYLNTTYMPWRLHFMEFSVTKNRNFGVRATSRTEGSHKEVKSYLFNTTADLAFLLQRISDFLEDQEADFKEAENGEIVKALVEHNTYDWLGDIRTKVARKAQQLIVQQHRLYRARIAAAVEARKRPREQERPLVNPPCTESFRNQFGLPCSHEIQQRICQNKPLNASDVDPHWHLSYDYADYDAGGNPWVGIRDPAVIPPPGRPVVGPIRIRAALIPPRTSNIRHQSAATRARELSYWEYDNDGGRGRGRGGAAATQTTAATRAARAAEIQEEYERDTREIEELFGDLDEAPGGVGGQSDYDDGDSGFTETDQLLEQATQQLKEEARRWDARVIRGEELGGPFGGA